jgi:hypothetical protein
VVCGTAEAVALEDCAGGWENGRQQVPRFTRNGNQSGKGKGEREDKSEGEGERKGSSSHSPNVWRLVCHRK